MGSDPRNSLNASSPPAEAPIPTTGNGNDPEIFSALSSLHLGSNFFEVLRF